MLALARPPADATPPVLDGRGQARARRVLWAYDRDHLRHPFIVISLNTLAQAGLDVMMVSSDLAPAGLYRSYDDFSFRRREERWETTVPAVRLALKQRAGEAAAKAAQAQKRYEATAPRDLFRRTRLRLWRWWSAGKARRLGDRLQRVKKLQKLRKDTIDTWLPYLHGFWRVMRLPTDVIVASRPQAAALAFLAAKLRRKRFVYFPFELYGDQAYRPSPIYLWLERMMFRWGIDALITQNDCRAKVYIEERGCRAPTAIVHNYKPIRASIRSGALRSALGIPADKRVVLYEGLLVEGRWLDLLAQAVLHLPDDVVLVMMGKNTSDWLHKAEAQLREPLTTGRLLIAPPVPHDGLLDYVAEADVGVIIYDDSVRNNVFCEPGKLSDYIAVGVPVVAPDFPTIGPVVRAYGIGACFSAHTPQAIAETVMNVLSRGKADFAPALRRAVDELTWETQVPQLITAITGTSPTYEAGNQSG